MVIIKNKNIWPLYIPPEKDELFSSWFCRLSNNHMIRSESFLTNYFGRMLPLWNRDIDMLMPNKYLNTISNHTPLTSLQIRNLFLISFETFAFDKANIHGLTNNILTLGIKHRKRRLNGILYCPNCLKTTPQYFRKQWRLSTSIICLECKCYLLDMCPNCKNPISYHRNNINNINNSTSKCNPLNICECGYDLSNFKKNEVISTYEISYQTFINNTISMGFNEHTQYSFLYIKALLILAYYIIRNNPKNKLFNIINEIYPNQINKTDKPFWLLNLNERKEILPLTYLLIQNIPVDLDYIFRVAKINRSDFFELPFFLESKIINK